MKLLVFFFTLITVLDLYAEPVYYVKINLNKTKDDKVMVELYPPVTESEYVTFHIPKVVPGTYDVSNFGQFLSNFKAFDSLGTELETHHLSTNKWQIKNNGKLHKLSYSVNDTYDRFGDYGDDTDENISAKIKKFNLIGIPYQLIIGKKAEGDFFEFKEVGGEAQNLKIDDVVSQISKAKSN